MCSTVSVFLLTVQHVLSSPAGKFLISAPGDFGLWMKQVFLSAVRCSSILCHILEHTYAEIGTIFITYNLLVWLQDFYVIGLFDQSKSPPLIRELPLNDSLARSAEMMNKTMILLLIMVMVMHSGVSV